MSFAVLEEYEGGKKKAKSLSYLSKIGSAQLLTLQLLQETDVQLASSSPKPSALGSAALIQGHYRCSWPANLDLKDLTSTDLLRGVRQQSSAQRKTSS